MFHPPENRSFRVHCKRVGGYKKSSFFREKPSFTLWEKKTGRLPVWVQERPRKDRAFRPEELGIETRSRISRSNPQGSPNGRRRRRAVDRCKVPMRDGASRSQTETDRRGPKGGRRSHGHTGIEQITRDSPCVFVRVVSPERILL